MKNNLTIGLAVLLFLACAGNGYSFIAQDWYYLGTGGGGTALYDSGGNDVSASANWEFQLICDAGSDTSVAGMIAANQWQIGGSAGNGASDDLIVGTVSYWDSGNQLVQGWNAGSTTDIPETYELKRFYLRFFDGAGNAGLIYNTGNAWTLVSAPEVSPTTAWADPASASGAGQNISGSRQASHNLSTDGFAAVIPVPEPGTFGLLAMGLGMVMAAARRKLRK